MHQIAPSILAADSAKLGEEVKEVINAGADWLHFDVMDQHYVPNLTFGPMVCRDLKPYAGDTPIDVHLMTSPVDALIESFAAAGAKAISFHPDATGHVQRSLTLIKKLGLKAGLALNPAMPVAAVSEVLDDLDYILLMAVNPGWGGQKFIPRTLEKIKQSKILTAAYSGNGGKKIAIAVDGGVNAANIAAVAAAGADIFVVGSAVFAEPDRPRAILNLRQQLAKGNGGKNG